VFLGVSFHLLCKFCYLTNTSQLVCVCTGSFGEFVDWRQCTAVMQREAVTVMPSCSGGGNVVVA
jgi:hypothetical protein